MWRAAVLAFLLQLGPPAADRVDTAQRDTWQRPAAVMDALGIHRGTRVADIGAGGGYFTFHLARRVGTAGRVYAVDLQRAALTDIAQRASKERLTQITTVQGTDEDPRLSPASVDVILVVNTYHEFRAFDAMMQRFRAALKPHGLLAVIEPEAMSGEPSGRAFRYHRISRSAVREDAARAGLRFVRNELGFVNPEGGLTSSYWFFLVFERPD